MAISSRLCARQSSRRLAPGVSSKHAPATKRAIRCWAASPLFVAHDELSSPLSQDQMVLATAERDVAEYCELHPELGKQCWGLHDWLVQKAQPEQHASDNTGIASDVLQRSLREVLSAGCIDQVFRSLAVLKNIDERRPSDGLSNVRPPPRPMPCSIITDQERVLLTRLFDSMDTNGDGSLSWTEFMTAMHDIDDDLDEEEQELISTALDLHGSLSLDQFLAVVEKAEEARSTHNCDARRLRHMMHRRPDTLDRMWTHRL